MRETPRTLLARTVGVPSIPNVAEYAFASPNGGADAQVARQTATRIASHVPVDQPHLAFVNSTAQAAFVTLDRVAQVGGYAPTVAYPNNGFGQALQMVAGAIVARRRHEHLLGADRRLRHALRSEHERRQRLVQHADDDAERRRCSRSTATCCNQGLLSDTLVLQFSEFGRRISENGSSGTDHGAASLMMAMGGSVRGGIYGTAANLALAPDNPTLENNGQDIRYETDFRSVYARVIDNWLGVGLDARFSAATSGTAGDHLNLALTAAARIPTRLVGAPIRRRDHDRGVSSSPLASSPMPIASSRSRMRSLPEHPPERLVELRIAEVIAGLLGAGWNDALAGDQRVGELANQRSSTRTPAPAAGWDAAWRGRARARAGGWSRDAAQ